MKRQERVKQIIKLSLWPLLILPFAAIFAYLLYLPDEKVAVAEPKTPFIFDGAGWGAEFIGEKKRDCVYVQSETYGLYFFDGIWHKTEFILLGDFRSRPMGKHEFGVWYWQAPEEAERVQVVVGHLCEGDKIDTVLGPYDLKKG